VPRWAWVVAERALPRVTRLLGLVAYLEDNGPTPFGDLAAHFDVSVEQIREDVNTLWVSGLPGHMTGDLIDFDFDAFEQDIASLTNSQGVTQIRLSAREAVALVGSLSTIVASGGAPRAAETALAKLGEALGDDPITVVSVSSVDPTVSTAVFDAVSRRRVAEVDYVDASDRSTTRAIEPHRVVTIDGVPYVECFCRRADDYRTLRLDRISAVRVSDEAVLRPPSDAGAFSLEPTLQARVVIARSGRWAIEDFPSVTIEDSGDDIVATFGVADATWAAARLLAVAPHLRVIEPAALAEELAAQARAVLAAHGA